MKLYDLVDYERVVWREKTSIQKFVEYFLYDEYSEINDYHLCLVLWSTTSMMVEYIDKSINKKDTILISMQAWEDYYHLTANI